MINTIPSIGAQIFDNVLTLSLSTFTPVSESYIPPVTINNIIYNGIPLIYNTEFLTYN